MLAVAFVCACGFSFIAIYITSQAELNFILIELFCTLYCIC